MSDYYAARVSLKLVVLFGLTLISLRGFPQSASDTLTTSYVTAIDNWLTGRDSLARQQLLTLPARPGSAEQISAWALLLDEYYYWPGHYARYRQLADSLHVTTGFYESAGLLAQQPAVRYTLAVDTFTLPIRIKHGSHPVVIVRINGKPGRFILDTGVQRTLLSRRYSGRMELRRTADVTINNYLGQPVGGDLLLADSLTLGRLTIDNLPVLSAQLPLGVDGLLGWDVLRQFVISIDYGHRQLTLRRSVPRSVAQPNLLGGSLPLLLMHGPQNNQLNISLDTGANHELSLSPTGLTKIGAYTTEKRLRFSRAVGTFFHVSRERTVRRLTVRMGDMAYSFRGVPIFRQDDSVGLIFRDGLIGSRVFRRGTLTLDGPNHWFTYEQP